jgi:hypothetical protein
VCSDKGGRETATIGHDGGFAWSLATTFADKICAQHIIELRDSALAVVALGYSENFRHFRENWVRTRARGEISSRKNRLNGGYDLGLACKFLLHLEAGACEIDRRSLDRAFALAMASCIMFCNQKGDEVVSRHYRNDVSKTAIDTFRYESNPFKRLMDR